MNKIYISIGLFVCAMVFALASCDKGPKQETPGGHEFEVVKAGDGKLPKAGQVLILDVSIVDPNDSAWFDNRNADYPEMVMINDDTQKKNEQGITEVFRLISKGDSVLFPMRAKDLFETLWKAPMPPSVDSESKFVFHIKCRDILDEPQALAFRKKCDSVHNEKEKVKFLEERAKQAEFNKEQLAKDVAIIDNFLKGKNVKGILKTESGLRYSVKKKGEGAQVQSGDLVTVRYSGELLDGTPFDSGEYQLRANRAEVIEGWDQMLLLMNHGSVVTVYIPSTLGYAHGGRPPQIMPDAILVFEMEVVALQKQ